MKVLNNYNEATQLLLTGSIGILPTDTIYGISCLASSAENVEKIYSIKQRDYDKPFIILLDSKNSLKNFGISPTQIDNEIFKKYWPGPVSIILDVEDKKLEYLHRGKNTLAFRIPKKTTLLELLKKTGPLVSTSANISSLEPVKNFEEAKIMFNDKLDFFLDEGKLNNPPSKIIRVTNGTETVVRD